MPLSKAALSRPLAWADQVAWGWFMVDGLTHLTLELSYLYFAFQMGGQTAAQSDSPAAFTWREYGKADVRWSGSDPGIMALELITVFGSGPLCLLCAWAIKERKAWRHILQASICVAELCESRPAPLDCDSRSCVTPEASCARPVAYLGVCAHVVQPVVGRTCGAVLSRI